MNRREKTKYTFRGLLPVLSTKYETPGRLLALTVTMASQTEQTVLASMQTEE